MAGALLGAVVGFPFGAFTGAQIDRHFCHCAEGGMGFDIGAQIGIAAGSILGYLFY